MAHKLYSPQLSEDVIRALYREAKKRRRPMTKLANEFLREALQDEITAGNNSAAAEVVATYSTTRDPVTDQQAA
jgi:hypothetical protein